MHVSPAKHTKNVAINIESKIIVYMCPTLAKIDYRNFMSVLLGESLI